MNRRDALTSTILAGTGLVVGCATLFNATVAQVASDVATIVNGLEATVPAIAAAAGLSSAAAQAVTTALSSLQTLATSVSNAASTTAQKPLIQQIEADINTIVATAAAIPGLPAEVTLALEAAEALLPVIEAIVGLVVTTPATPRPGLVRRTPTHVRALLKAVAAA